MGSWGSRLGTSPPQHITCGPCLLRPLGSAYLEDPAEAEAGVHELDELEQQLQGVDVAVKAVPQIDVLHLRWARVQGGPRAASTAPDPAAVQSRPPRTFTATSVPSCSLARCTWARLAAAMG